VKSTVSSHSTKEQELPESKKVDSSSFSDNALKMCLYYKVVDLWEHLGAGYINLL
jgi:hypothetical protein